MIHLGTHKLVTYPSLTAIGLLIALATGQPRFVALGAPFLMIVIIGLVTARAPELDVLVELDRVRAFEGDLVRMTIRLSSDRDLRRVDVFLSLREGLTEAEGSDPRAICLERTGEKTIGVLVRCERWGAYPMGRLHIRAHGAMGVGNYEGWIDRDVWLRVYPRAETVRSLLRPRQTQVFAGNQVARQRGEGIEFSDLRPFVAGDRIRKINWRASARSRELWVNEYHAERNADVVIFIDSFAELQYGRLSSLDVALRAAAGVAERYLRHRDRVGILSYGGTLAWLAPRMGIGELYRIFDSLIETRVLFTYVSSEVGLLPRQLLPPQALVIAISPLIDERSERALLDLRARGFDIAVVEISPSSFLPPSRTASEQIARKVWDLQREVRRGRLESLGISVGRWDEHREFEEALEEVRLFRRLARQAPA